MLKFKDVAISFLVLFALVPTLANAQQAQIAQPTVQGPASAVSGHIATFNGATGRIIQDGGAAATGTVTSVATGACLTGGPITTTGTVSGTYVINAQTGTTYTIQTTDACELVTFSNAASIAVTLPQATSSFGAGFSFDVQNKGVGTVTITPTTSTINGASTLVVPQNMGCTIVSDGTNWQVSACAPAGTLPVSKGGTGITSFGTGVATALGTNVSGTGAICLASGSSCSSGSGVTSVATNNGVTGGTITTTGTIGLASIAADNLLANSTGSSAPPIATAIGSCSTGASALTYDTTTHAFGCNSISGSGTVNSGTTPNVAYYASSGTAVSDGGAATVTIGSVNLPNGGSAPTTGISNPGGGAFQISTGGTGRVVINSSGVLSTIPLTSGNMSSSSTNGPAILFASTSSATVPTLIPAKSALTSGFGGVANGPAVIVGGASIENWQSTGPSILVVPTDATFTDNSLCINTTSHIVYTGSGTLGICLGTSTKEAKQNIVPLSNDALSQIMQLKPVSFNYKAGWGYDPKKPYYGFLAEDVVKVLPRLVGHDAKGKLTNADYLGMTPIIVRALQQQQDEINHLWIAVSLLFAGLSGSIVLQFRRK